MFKVKREKGQQRTIVEVEGERSGSGTYNVVYAVEDDDKIALRFEIDVDGGSQVYVPPSSRWLPLPSEEERSNVSIQ